MKSKTSLGPQKGGTGPVSPEKPTIMKNFLVMPMTSVTLASANAGTSSHMRCGGTCKEVVSGAFTSIDCMRLACTRALLARFASGGRARRA